MTPAAKFYALVSSATVAAMFFIVTWIAPAIKNFGWGATAWIAAVLSSVGIYRIVALGAELLLHKWEFARSFIFGGSYLHGTWVGYFTGRAKDKRFVVEHIDQDLDGAVIIGRSFTSDLEPHADWNSISVSIDSRNGRMIYSYALTILTRPGTLIGIGSMQLERKSHRNAATSIAGHAQDLGDQVRVQIEEIKVSDKLLPWKEALAIAQKKFP
jgi:hypothetical protein